MVHLLKVYLLATGCFLIAGDVRAESHDPLDWWSLKPLTRPDVPDLDGHDALGRKFNAVDHFIVAKHDEHRLSLSPEANRQTLIRRLSFDLIGLPPSPEEVEAFAADESPDAYERLVERLLASPRYGERWARHWLDVVHYGDTHGYDKDKLRPNAYPYRDYIIRAFNEDKNYSRFVREQIAGDVLWPDTVDGIVATGFIAAGPWDFIGHAEVPETKIDGKVARHLDRDDMVANTFNSFCALTVQCAQCHDHKRDPVSMEDYYSLQAVFAALDRADRPYDSDPRTRRMREQLTVAIADIRRGVAENEEAIKAAKTPELLALEKRIAELDKCDLAGRSDRYGYHSKVARRQGEVKWVQVDFGEPVVIEQLIIAASDEYGFADFGFPHRFKIEAADEPEFKAPHVIADHTGTDYPRPGAGLVLLEPEGVTARFVRVTAKKLWNRRKKGNSLTEDWIFALGELAVLSGGRIVEVKAVTAKDSIEALPRWGKADLTDGVYGAFPIAADALLATARRSVDERERDLAELRSERNRLVKESIDPPLFTRREQLDADLKKAEAELAALPRPKMVYAGTIHSGSGTFKGTGHDGGKPRKISVLARGDVTKPGDEVGPGTLRIIPDTPSRFELPPDHAEGDRRVALAEWIVHEDNPLTWRAIVNRVWLYHFGRGIVDSPNDFGRMGQLPSHPELLDWLAVEFRDGRQSIKDLHRLIVNSATYRQSSDSRAVALKVDGGNRYLWRMNRRKLEGEALRDTVLHVAGKLDTAMYGPGYYDFVLEKTEHSPHYQYHKHDPDDPKSHRRSIYRFLVRSQPAPFMTTLDCADPSLSVDKRNETLTALQALAMLNNKFVVRMSEHFAGRGRGCRGSGRTCPRPSAVAGEPREGELRALREYSRRHGIAATCRVILNSMSSPSSISPRGRPATLPPPLALQSGGGARRHCSGVDARKRQRIRCRPGRRDPALATPPGEGEARRPALHGRRRLAHRPVSTSSLRSSNTTAKKSDFGEHVEAFQNGLGPWMKPVWDFKPYGGVRQDG